MENISRRSFVSFLGAIATVFTGSKAFGVTTPKPKPKKKPVKPTKKPVPKKTTPPVVETLAPIQLNSKQVQLQDIPLGQSLAGTYIDPKTHLEKSILLHRTSAATVVAFSAICTHRGCTVEVNNPTSFDCPCHGSSYNSQNGSVITGPATRPLVPLVVKSKDGALSISSH